MIIGGTHISSLPESLAPEMDLAVIGEGEQTFAEVVDTMIRHGMDMEHLGGLPGLAYRDTAGRIILGPDRNLIDPLDRIALPARDLLRIPMRGELYVFSSRGCPGGWRIVKTMGQRITKLKPFEGFCSETAGSITLFAATHWGIPVSTTHTITGAIMGVGARKGVSAVKWGITTKIFWAWILPIPVSAIIGAALYYLFDYIIL